MECELLRSPMISYRSLLYNTTVLYDYELSMSQYILPAALLLTFLETVVVQKYFQDT